MTGRHFQVLCRQRQRDGTRRAAFRQAVLAVTRILVLAILVTRIAAASLYTATCSSGYDYHPPKPDVSRSFNGINKSGEIVGDFVSYTSLYPIAQGFLYSGGTFKFFGAGVSFYETDGPAAFFITAAPSAAAINSSGQIAGATENGNGTAPQAYLYSNGVLKPLGFLPGTGQSFATALNDSGQVVGYAKGVVQCGPPAGCVWPQVSKEAFLYSGGSMTALGYLPGFNRSQANAINNAGQIVGYSTINSGPLGHAEAFVVQGGVMTSLGTLPGFTDSVATAINDKGQIVGYAYYSYTTTYPGSPENYVVSVYRAFLYSGGIMRPLGPDSGLVATFPESINNEGQIVGSADLGGTQRAFLYTDGRMYDLNDLAGPGALNNLSNANGINDSGPIIASGSWPTTWPFGERNSYSSENCLLTPRPQQGAAGGFVPTTPCRIADTRTSGGPIYPNPYQVSSFTIAGNCGIPATAYAYSLNVTAVPRGPLGYLALESPGVSTLNSWKGNVVANAAVVWSDFGAIPVSASEPTDLILDVNGYFDITKGDAFYPVTPCRVADTRNLAGLLGGPLLAGFEIRTFPVLSSPCGLPPSATAYSMNLTAVPRGSLDFLTTWAAGQPRPYVSTLNSSTGNAVANAAIVAAGAGGATSVYATNPTDLIIDVNGYFAAAGSPGGLTFYPTFPCRVADTRSPDGPLGGPELASRTPRSFSIPAGPCNIPPEAQAYSLNVTALPDGALSYLTVWPAGTPKPQASTLNTWDGSAVANAAIVAAGTGGAISIYATDPTNVILDINGYFAP